MKTDKSISHGSGPTWLVWIIWLDCTVSLGSCISCLSCISLPSCTVSHDCTLHSMLWLTCLIICALCAGVLYMFYAQALVCDHYFVPSLDVIIGRLTGSWYTCTSLFGRTDYNHYNQRISRDRAACGHCTVQWLEYPWLTFVKGISHIPTASNPAVQSFCLM